MNCSNCKNNCLNRCSDCGKPWCAPCRDTYGKTCNACRSRRQQRTAQSRAAKAQPTVYYIPSPQVQTPTGKALSDMDIEERRDWLEDVLKGLKEKIESDSNYLQGRANRNQGVQRSTDVLMSRHLQVLRDIYNTLEAELDTYLVPPPLGQPHTGYTGLITPQYPTNPQPKP